MTKKTKKATKAQHRIDVLEVEKAEFEANVEKLTVACANKTLEIARLQDENKRLQHEIERCVARDVERYDEIADLTDKLAELTREGATVNRWFHEHKPLGWTGVPKKAA